MPYCSRCGVEVDGATKTCVLCKSPIQILDPVVDGIEHAYAPHPWARAKPSGERKAVVWELSTGLCGVAAFTTAAVDLVLNGRVTWSAYPLTGIAAAWVYLTLALFFIRRPWIATAGWSVATLVYLASLNAIDTTHSWFVPLGFPLTIMAGAALALFLVVLMRVKSVTSIAAVILGTAALLCLCLDFVINRFLGHPGVGWSLIVSAAIAPLEGLLAFHAVFLRKRVDLRRFFDV